MSSGAKIGGARASKPHTQIQAKIDLSPRSVCPGPGAFLLSYFPGRVWNLDGRDALSSEAERLCEPRRTAGRGENDVAHFGCHRRPPSC